MVQLGAFKFGECEWGGALLLPLSLPTTLELKTLKLMMGGCGILGTVMVYLMPRLGC